MGKLYLIHDFSPSRPWLYSSLNAHRKLLEEQELLFAPFNSFSREWQFTHEHFFRKFKPGATPSDNILKLWKRLKNRAASGKDILVFTHKPFFEAHADFWEKLEKNTTITCDNVRQLFIIVPPAVTLEQRYREFPNLSLREGEDLSRAYANLLLLIQASEERLGAACVKVLVNLNPNVAAKPALEEEISKFLERDAELSAPGNYLHPLIFRSAFARRVSRVTGTRGNQWKPLDTRAFADALAAFEQNLDEDFASPLSLRVSVTQKSAAKMALLGKKLNLPKGSLAPGLDIVNREAAPKAENVDSELLRAFVKTLPVSVKTQLRERFHADEIILTSDQRLVLDSLRKEEGAKRIGDAEPPVELCVLTMAYNQEKYIGQCIESVLAQKTDFPVRHIILDHNSDDATPRIIREYARKFPSIRPVLLARRTPEENVRGLFSRCRTKYAALCDGDDYFCDPLKLQKQVDFLENRPDCALCFHPVRVTFEDGSTPFLFPLADMLPKNTKTGFYLAQLTRNNFIQTNSVLYRWRFRDGLPAWFRADLCPGDWYWHLLHAETGKIGFLPEVMAVYRRHKKALYANAFNKAREHWRARGLSELRAYSILNDHFKDRYYRNFSILASGVFAEFCKIAEKENDDSLLNKAADAYPRFALDFFKSLNNLSK